ncbi:MAG TPA: hypothetical protein VHG30_02820 [Microvirga sp.]|nr:hypothetical protein [Microvirga sp.]
MVQPRKLFRIEAVNRSATDGPDDGRRHAEIMAALADLRAMLMPSREVGPNILEEYRREIAQAAKLKDELDAISEAIAHTKRELASLHRACLRGPAVAQATDHLDAIVSGTEQATNAILAAAEVIDEHAGNLAAKLKGDENGMACDIQDQVVRIFEACNFQDLTGQRITKVVDTLRFIESRVARMTDIWGGLESFAEIQVEPLQAGSGDQALLNGPGLEGEQGRATQAEIDALFA